MVKLYIMALYTALAPPAQYDHPYNGPVITHHIAPQNLPATICHAGCAGFLVKHGRKTRTCVIILPKGAPAEVRRHEMAHCNGWPADHRH